MIQNQPKLKRDWVGRYVRLTHAIETVGGIIFDAGEVMRVDKYYCGLALDAIHTCQHCRRRTRQRVVRIAIQAVELLPADYRPPQGERP